MSGVIGRGSCNGRSKEMDGTRSAVRSVKVHGGSGRTCKAIRERRST